MPKTIPELAAPRNELMSFFDDLAKKQLIYLHAPAGFGKTFSTRLWLASRSETHTWVSLSESSGRKAADYYLKCASAFLTLQPENTALYEILSHESFNSAPLEFMERILSSFRTYSLGNEDKYIYVIDDLHFVNNADILKHLAEHLSGVSGKMTVCLLSRTEPPVQFSELILKGNMAVADVECLKFTTKEIRSFFTSRGWNVSEKQAVEIKEATDGWAIGLNALLLSGGRKTDRILLSRYLETFIREQVWEKWSQQRRDFMLSISLEDDLTPEFCTAMTNEPDSAEILAQLVRENAFISVDEEGVYRFHHLFRDFLRHMLAGKDEKFKKTLYRAAGDWFFKRADYYRSVNYYKECGSKNGVAKSLKHMYNYNSPYASILDTVDIIHQSVDDSLVEEYPFLLETLAWAAFAEGRGEDMEKYIDSYIKQLPMVILQNPSSAQTSVLIRCMDYRNSLLGVSKSLKVLPLSLFAQANTPSFSSNMPFLHRSSRDFSEFAPDEDNSLPHFAKTVGVLVGDEYKVMEMLLRAGFAFERSDFDTANKLAVAANAGLKQDFAPETKFCSFLLLAEILDARGQTMDADKVLDGAGEMIDFHKAFYLNENYRAFLCRRKLFDGDTDAAQEWLKNNAGALHENLTFFKLFQHFVTARAYITTGDYITAILFLKKLLTLCELYRRPLDTIEANILLAVANWKKGRGAQNDAFEPLGSALNIAREYRYSQLFVNEGAEISTMLHRLQKRVIQKDYNGDITLQQVKPLYIQALARAKRYSGLTGGSLRQNLKFTPRQKEVMHHLCAGLTQREIADELGLKPSAIKSHMILIYKKLDVSNSIDAIMKIRDMNILDG